MATFDKSTEEFRQRRDEINGAYENPDLVAESIHDKFRDLTNANPFVGTALAERASNTLSYLKEIMPMTVEKKGPFSREVLPPGMQMAGFNRNYEVAYDPREYFESVERGDVTRGMTQTFNRVWPELAMNFKEEFLDRLGDDEDLDMPFNTKVNMSMALGIDADPLLAAQFVLPLQQVIAQATNEEAAQKEGGAVKPTMTGLSKIDMAQMTRTASQTVLEQPKPWK